MCPNSHDRLVRRCDSHCRKNSFHAHFVMPGIVPGIHGVPSMFNSWEVQVLYPS
jgi:hypothetical protein